MIHGEGRGGIVPEEDPVSQDMLFAPGCCSIEGVAGQNPLRGCGFYIFYGGQVGP